MNWLDRYVKPHKNSVLLLMAFDALILISSIGDSYVGTVLGIVSLALLVRIGFESRKALGYGWMETAKTGVAIGLLLSLVDLLGLAFTVILGGGNSLAAEYGAVGFMLLSLIGIVMDVVLVLLGHAMAHLMMRQSRPAPMAAAPKAGQTVGRKSKPAAHRKSAGKRKH